MTNPFSNISQKIEQHPVMAAAIVGVIGIVVTIYFVGKKNKSASNSTSTQSVCTDANGDVVDCGTGLPIGSSGGFSLQPTNNNGDVITAIGNLSQIIQNLVTQMGSGNNVVNPPPTNNPPPTTNPPPTRYLGPPIPRPNNPAPQIPPKPITTIITPGPSGGVNPPSPLRRVTVAQWSSTNTPWNSTLWGIATHFNESLAQIERLNPQIKNPNLIYPGQRINY